MVLLVSWDTVEHRTWSRWPGREDIHLLSITMCYWALWTVQPKGNKLQNCCYLHACILKLCRVGTCSGRHLPPEIFVKVTFGGLAMLMSDMSPNVIRHVFPLCSTTNCYLFEHTDCFAWFYIISFPGEKTFCPFLQKNESEEA